MAEAVGRDGSKRTQGLPGSQASSMSTMGRAWASHACPCGVDGRLELMQLTGGFGPLVLSVAETVDHG